jgi:hypothetical protein
MLKGVDRLKEKSPMHSGRGRGSQSHKHSASFRTRCDSATSTAPIVTLMVYALTSPPQGKRTRGSQAQESLVR